MFLELTVLLVLSLQIITLGKSKVQTLSFNATALQCELKLQIVHAMCFLLIIDNVRKVRSNLIKLGRRLNRKMDIRLKTKMDKYSGE